MIQGFGTIVPFWTPLNTPVQAKPMCFQSQWSPTSVKCAGATYGYNMAVSEPNLLKIAFKYFAAFFLTLLSLMRYDCVAGIMAF